MSTRYWNSSIKFCPQPIGALKTFYFFTKHLGEYIDVRSNKMLITCHYWNYPGVQKNCNMQVPCCKDKNHKVEKYLAYRVSVAYF